MAPAPASASPDGSLPPHTAPATFHLQPASQPALSPPWAQTGQGEQFPVFLPPALFNPRSSSQSLRPRGDLWQQSSKNNRESRVGQKGPRAIQTQGISQNLTWLGSKPQPPPPPNVGTVRQGGTFYLWQSHTGLKEYSYPHTSLSLHAPNISMLGNVHWPLIPKEVRA